MSLPGDGCTLTNLEGESGFDVTWPWVAGRLRRGATAVLRVKDEARSLPFALPGLLRCCDEVLVVDNGSTDGTPEVARAVAEASPWGGRLRSASYPFRVARAGAEHLATPERSVHSLAYFYNWSFAQVRTTYSWKWDGDMVLTPEGERSLRDLGWQVGAAPAVVRMPRHGLYVESARRAHLDLGWHNREEWGFPVGPDFVYRKAYEWEIRTTPVPVRRVLLPPGLAVELKWLDGDEFAHWTDPAAFAGSWRNQRKHREWQVFHALREGSVPEGVVTVDAPEGVHVVDHVTRTWLPRHRVV